MRWIAADRFALVCDLLISGIWILAFARMTACARMIVLFCALFPALSCAQTPFQTLHEKLNQFRSMQANFTQTVYSADGTVLQKSNGKMLIQRPGKFRWEVNQPMHQLIVTDGKTVWIDEPDLQQVTIRDLDLSVGETPVLLLTGDNTYLEKTFKVKRLENHKKGNGYELIPLKKEDTFNKIILCFDGDILQQMELQNQLGQNTQLMFSDTRINPSLSARSFVFTIPKGVDVIDQRIRK